MSKFILKRILAPFLSWSVKRRSYDIVEFSSAIFVVGSFIISVVAGLIALDALVLIYCLLFTVIPFGVVTAILDLYGRHFINKKEYDLHGQHCGTITKGYNFWLYLITKLLIFFYRDHIMVVQPQYYDWIKEQGYDSYFIMPSIPNDYYINNICMSAFREVDVYGYKETMLLSTVQSVVVLFNKEDIVITKLYIK